MMKNRYNAVKTKLFALIAVLFLAVTLAGCNDPAVTDIKAQHRELTLKAERELRAPYSFSAYAPAQAHAAQ